MNLEDVILRGTRAAQPAATAVPAGTLYFVTDETTLERSNGAVWQSYSVSGSGTGITQLTGDVTAGPGSGSQVATIPAATITYAKIQDISAASRLLGRGGAAGAGDTEEITVGSGLSLSATTLTAVGTEWDNQIVKSANQDVTNTVTLTDDTELQFAVTAGSVWQIEMILLYSNDNGSNDFKLAFAVSAGALRGSYLVVACGTTDVVNQQVSGSAAGAAATGVINLGTGADITVIRVALITATFFFSAIADFKFQFAEVVAAISTSARCNAGSLLRGKRII